MTTPDDLSKFDQQERFSIVFERAKSEAKDRLHKLLVKHQQLLKDAWAEGDSDRYLAVVETSILEEDRRWMELMRDELLFGTDALDRAEWESFANYCAERRHPLLDAQPADSDAPGAG